MTNLPVACSLHAPELRARRDGLLLELRRSSVEQRTLQNGLALRFEPEPGRLAALAEVLDLVRQWCRLLHFKLTVAAGEGPIWLEMTGPRGTTEFLAMELGFEIDEA